LEFLQGKKNIRKQLPSLEEIGLILIGSNMKMKSRKGMNRNLIGISKTDGNKDN